MSSSAYIHWFSELGMEDVALVGGKNASLGELYRELVPQGVRVPNGFAVAADAYRALLTGRDLWGELHRLLDGLDNSDVSRLSENARRARELVYGAPLPPRVQAEILDSYHRLQEEYGAELTVAVRSSATAEDLPSASFAGQHESYLHVSGDNAVLDAVRRCFASIFTDRAIIYRNERGFDHFKVFLSVGVMKTVRSDLAASGVTFSIDTESGHPDVVFTTASYGLGENIVQGNVDPDEFYVHKPTFRAGFRAVLRRVLGSKQMKLVYAAVGENKTTRNLETSRADRERFCLSDDDVLTLADYAIKVEDHYSEKAGHRQPMDIEWAKDGVDGQLYLVQARPETVVSQRPAGLIEEYSLQSSGEVLVEGRAVGARIASGRAHVIRTPDELAAFKPGEVLVAETTTPDWEPVMKTAAAVVTDRGGRTCHAAIVARELGVPAVVGAQDATTRLANASAVTVSCAEGDIGRVYAGELPFTIESLDVADLPRPATEILVNLGNPDVAFKTSLAPNDGVGLARTEFIISEYIKAHPMALVHPERVVDEVERSQIAELTRGYESPSDYFVERLSEGVGTIAAAFHPRPVVVRMSDFKTNEYAALLGGRPFEPEEDNPMLGFRGASRYAHPSYAEGFALECAAMKRVRETMGLTNLKLMIPFCRKVEEAERVLAAMADNGLHRGAGGLEVYVMCEIPNNVIQIDAFARLFDGFSIGSNDLTQLVLGVDRNSEIVAFDFDEHDPGVMEMIHQTIDGARRNGRHSAICGQAPSDYPDIAQRLVEFGIDAISLNPDALVKTTRVVLETEDRIGGRPRRS